MMNTQEKARSLMVRRQNTQKNRQESMLERLAAEIGDFSSSSLQK